MYIGLLVANVTTTAIVNHTRAKLTGGALTTVTKTAAQTALARAMEKPVVPRKPNESVRDYLKRAFKG